MIHTRVTGQLLISLSLACFLGACTVVRWQAVQANVESTQAPAYLSIKETGADYGPIPSEVYVREKFDLLEPRVRFYTFVFRKKGLASDEVRVRLDDWKCSPEDAKRDPNPIAIRGILGGVAPP
jgi:hypothetical protein